MCISYLYQFHFKTEPLAVILCRFVILTTSIHFNNIPIVRVLSGEHLSKVKSAYSARNGVPTIKVRQACSSLSPFAKRKWRMQVPLHNQPTSPSHTFADTVPTS